MARRKRPSTPVLDALGDAERDAVLRELLLSHPELLSEAEELATQAITTVSADAIADAVTSALVHIPFGDLTARAGKHRGGYVEPHEAAWELVERVLDPFVDDLRRAATLGQPETAVTIAVGILTGLHQVPAPADGTVLAYAGSDTLDDLSDSVLHETEKLGLQIPATLPIDDVV